jgi:hypothetical protein
MRTFMLFFVVSLMMASAARAVDTRVYKSDPGTVFCITWPDLDEVIQDLDKDGKTTVPKALARGDCAIVKQSLEVYIEEEKLSPSGWGTMVKVRREGKVDSVWTMKKFLQ